MILFSHRTDAGPLNGSADNEDAVELVRAKGQQANGNISRQLDSAVDGEVWEAGDSGSDDGHVMARLSCRSHLRYLPHHELSLSFAGSW